MRHETGLPLVQVAASLTSPGFSGGHQQNHTTMSMTNLLLVMLLMHTVLYCCIHDDVSKWKHFPRYWPFVRGIHRSPMTSPHKGQWRGAWICARINVWTNNREAGYLRRHRAHYDSIVMFRWEWKSLLLLLLLLLLLGNGLSHVRRPAITESNAEFLSIGT